MKYKIKEFLSDKRNILILLLDLLLSLIITLRILNNRIEIIDIKNINIWLFLLIFFIISFIFSHFIFNIKELYNFVYKKRYIISLIILFILVIGKFHGSSIGMWNIYVDPSDDYSKSTIIGKSRAIRSDEWLVNTPYAFSQQLNDYKYYNDLARAEKTDMFSVIFTPIKDIIILSRPFNIGYLLLGNDYGLSFYWYGRLIALILVTFELFMLITNKKKLISLAGAITISGSAIVMWFYSNYIVDLLISGQLCLLLFNSFLKNHNNKKKLIYSILIALSFSWFLLTFYPPWQISLGYVFLMFAIWIFVKNKKETKLGDYKFLLLTIVLVMILLVRYLMLSSEVLKIVMSTVYPGSRNELGGGSFLSLFNYPFSLFYPFKDYGNPCKVSTVFSLFPIPIIVSIIYLFKFKKDDKNLLIKLLLIVVVFFICFVIFQIPTILAKLTLLNKVTLTRLIPVICIICCYLMCMTIGTIDIKKKYYNVIFLIVSILLSLGIVYLCYKCSMNYSSIKLVGISVIVVSLLIYFYLTSKKKVNCVLLCLLLLIIGLLNLIFVNPVIIGTDMIYKKDTSIEIQKIISNDKNARWIALDNFVLPNYVLMLGGKVINSTNIYPNLELWERIDKEKRYEDIYNRYAHITVSLTTNETNFKLTDVDLFTLYLNYNDIKKLKVDYFICNHKLDIIEKYRNSFQLVYNSENIYIYKYKE